MKLLSILKHLVLGGLLLIAAAGTAFAQTAANFPDRLVRIVVPFGAGTTTDQAARFIAQRITEQTKQTVIVENKAGANGFIGVQYMLSQPADGYTILIGTNTTHAANRALFKKLPYDPVADFIPLTGVIVGGVVLTVSPNMPVNNVPELIATLTPAQVPHASNGPRLQRGPAAARRPRGSWPLVHESALARIALAELGPALTRGHTPTGSNS